MKVIDQNPETEVTGIISGFPEPPYSLRIAKKPMASSFSITSTWANGVKHVGFVMIGGTEEQFDNSVRLQKIKNRRSGWRNGPFVHATAGRFEGYEDDDE